MGSSVRNSRELSQTRDVLGSLLGLQNRLNLLKCGSVGDFSERNALLLANRANESIDLDFLVFKGAGLLFAFAEELGASDERWAWRGGWGFMVQSGERRGERATPCLHFFLRTKALLWDSESRLRQLL